MLKRLGVEGAGVTSVQDVIKIGAFGPMTGRAAGNGQSMREAIDLVVEEVNTSGGVLGRKIQTRSSGRAASIARRSAPPWPPPISTAAAVVSASTRTATRRSRPTWSRS